MTTELDLLEAALTAPSLFQARVRVRARLLRQAATLLSGDPWHRARKLHRAARAFERCRWRDRDQPPPGASDLDRLLWQCRRYGCDLDISARTIFNDIAD